MAYTGTLTTLSGVLLMSGENVDATAIIEYNVNQAVGFAEQYLALIGKYDFVANVATLTALGKEVLSEYCARSAALSLIAYNLNSYTTRIEAEDMINIHLYRTKQIEQLLADQNYIKQITGV